MIQRKQSIFLALAAIFLTLLFVFPVYGFEKDGEKFEILIHGMKRFFPDGESLVEANSSFPMIALNVLSILLLVVIIFLYNNRKQQMLLCKIATLLITGLIVAIFYCGENAKSLPELGGYASTIRPIVVAPLAALILVILANRAIKKDDELVRSADRLR